MAKAKTKGKRVEDYRHDGATRPNNPPAGLAWQDTETPPKRRFAYDPHLDPQLVWAGKAERTSFDVEAPSIHVHERLATDAIIRAVQKQPAQPALFEDPELDRSRAIEFYEHEMDWVNRMILGDSLVVMSSLLEKERLGGQVQMIYIDPPYGINFNSNFQARIGNRTPKETADVSVTREPEQVQAYRDTWELGVHSYLTYLRDRLLVTHEMLSETGSVFVQIGPDRMHLVKTLLDEVFGPGNACPTITVAKTSQVTSKLLPEVSDFLLWYAKDKTRVKYFHLFEERDSDPGGAYQYIELPDGERRKLTAGELSDPALRPPGSRLFTLSDATSQGFSAHKTVDFEFDGATFHPGPNRHWLLRPEGMQGLAEARRLFVVGRTLRYVRYGDDFPGSRRTNIWTDTGQAGFAQRKKAYVVETNPKIAERCVAMTTEPGDLVIDPTCGSGTTAAACEKLGRRWITIDTSRVALSLARERLLVAKFDYYKLKSTERGVDAGFEYKSLTRVTASSIGYGEDSETEVLYDQPVVESNKVRVSGPFTVEALSRYAMHPLQDDVPPTPDDAPTEEAQDHVSTLLSALDTQGIPRKGAKPLEIAALEPLEDAAGAIQAEGTYADAGGAVRSFGVSLGPRFGPITVAQIDEALHDAYGYDLVVFAGFAAMAEAQDYLARGRIGKFNVALLEANPDLLVDDLLKTTSKSQTFRLFSAPDAEARAAEDGEVVVEVRGVDAFDALSGEVTSRSRDDIAAWFLDHDYDGVVFHVNQAFFPRSNGWEALQKTLKATIDPGMFEHLQGFESIPFKPAEHNKAAIRVVDDSGTTSEAVLDLDGVV